jgi:hypothetical protein
VAVPGTTTSINSFSCRLVSSSKGECSAATISPTPTGSS